MATSFLLIGTVLISLSYTVTTDINLLNDNIDDSASSRQMKDIVIDAVKDYLQEHEKRLATLRKHIEDYSKENKRAIGKVAQRLLAANQESFKDDHKEIEVEEDKDDNTESEKEKYQKLCTGGILPSTAIQKKLRCRYIDRGIPFLKIAPFKEEEAYLDPRIVLYHDVLYKEEIEAIKILSEPRLEKARIINATDGQPQDSKERIAKNCWLYDQENKHVEILSRRVEYMTGLTIETAEAVQVAYYEIGGLYTPHFDFVAEEDVEKVPYFRERKIGNRIATALFYLNDVTEGGTTIFTQLNVTIRPKKGSALFWYNLERNGRTNFLTRHGACPVLSGTKWIVTKWLHERGQEFIRPCSLSKNE